MIKSFTKIVAVALATTVMFYNLAAQAVTIDMVPVGNPGNTNDTTGYGSVAETFLVGKYEITNAQWIEFLAAKAALGDPYGLYNTEMVGDYAGIARGGSGIAADPYVYSLKGNDANWNDRPVNYVSFWDAARFCNWMHNGQGDGDTETGAYTLNGYNGSEGHSIVRNTGAKWFIPSENEWYKAAYHKNDGATGNYWDYPTESDSQPGRDVSEATNPGNNANYTGDPLPIDSPYYLTSAGEFELSASPYGTFDQGGNVTEWTDTGVLLGGNRHRRFFRGGAYGDHVSSLYSATQINTAPNYECAALGFRVASAVPEPSGLVLLVMAGVAVAIIWRRRRST